MQKSERNKERIDYKALHEGKGGCEGNRTSRERVDNKATHEGAKLNGPENFAKHEKSMEVPVTYGLQLRTGECEVPVEGAIGGGASELFSPCNSENEESETEDPELLSLQKQLWQVKEEERILRRERRKEELRREIRATQEDIKKMKGRRNISPQKRNVTSSDTNINIGTLRSDQSIN